MQIRKYSGKLWEISWKKWLSRFGQIGGASGQTGGRESQGPSDLVCKLIFFQIGKIGAPYITDSNSVELFSVDFFWLRNRPPKLKYHFLRGSFSRLTSKVRRGPCLSIAQHASKLRFESIAAPREDDSIAQCCTICRILQSITARRVDDSRLSIQTLELWECYQLAKT